MAHRIEKHDKQQGLKQAWHRLTEIVTELTLKHNWLRTWEIVQFPLWVRGADMKAKGLNVSDNIQTVYSQLVASDAPDCLIGKPFADSYRPLTNAEFLGMLENALEGTHHQLESIGTVRNRGRRFASFNVSALSKYTAGGRTFEPYLNAGDSLDQSSQLWWNTSNTCTVCDNTFGFNLDNSATQRTKHTKGVMTRVAGFSAMIEKAVGVHAEFAAAFETLASKPITPNAARNVYAGFVGADATEKLSARAIATVDELEDLFVRGRGNRGQSLADLFSGATDYFTHNNVAGRGVNRLTRQFESSEFGTSAQRKADFWKIVNNDESLISTANIGAQLLKLS